MGYLISIIFTALFLLIIYRSKFYKSENLNKHILPVLFLIKVSAGIALLLIYTYYYKTRISADVFKYFDDGMVIFSSLADNPLDYLKMITGIDADAEHLQKYYTEANFWFKEYNYNLFNENRTMIRFNALIRLISFLSFSGLVAIFKSIRKLFRKKEKFLLIFLFLMPSVLLWTSGVLKESLAVFALGFLIYSYIKINQKQNIIRNSILLTIMAVLLFLTKFYIFIAILPGFISYLMIREGNDKYAFIKFISIHFLGFLLLINTQYFSSYNFIEIVARKQRDFINMLATLDNVGSLININKIEPNTISLLVNIPIGFWNTMVRPLITEISSPIAILAALENILIEIILIVTLIFSSYKNITDKRFFWLTISFTLILFSLSGMTTPVAGALVRYKSPALPFLLMALLMLCDIDKLLAFKKKILKQNNE
ncbi:MAG: hypothetical protein C0594_11425 [Marinilabiliales bacterium]|nr:MAG: hypothetical protein C0594_11425 [Marinilabiliales bacterium]